MFRKLWNILFGKRYDEISFRQSYELTDLAIITFYQGTNKFNFMLDTGSTKNIINKSVLRGLDYESTERAANLMGADGNVKEVDICMLTFTYKENSFKFPYLISDMDKAFEHIKKTTGATIHGIIGTEFFNAYKYVLDFEKLVAYSKS